MAVTDTASGSLPAITVRSIEPSIIVPTPLSDSYRFFTDVLGFEVRFETEDKKLAILGLGDLKIHFTAQEDEGPDANKPEGLEIRLRVSNVKAVADKARMKLPSWEHPGSRGKDVRKTDWGTLEWTALDIRSDLCLTFYEEVEEGQ
ncbi:hypothetical protein HDU93_006810 [Gonapodya sp. JEL0774]|nr:hypothetical protein HDU93_006810 [Gonapodya sp. JEL0774]